METSATQLSFLKRIKSFINILEWLPQYKFSYLGMDLIAGLTLASFVLPQAMAYASLAGVAPEHGIYCVIAGGLLFAFFTSSRQTFIGPTSAISLMVGTTVAVMAEGDMQRWAAIASLTALVIFVLCVAAYLLRLSSLVSFISENILLGFKAGAALTIISTQLPKLFAVKGGGTNFFNRTAIIFENIGDTNLYVFAFGIIAFIVLFGGSRLLPSLPVSLIVVIASILVISFTDISQYGFKLAGEIPKGLPPIGRPSLRFSDVDGILALALGCFLMGYIETIAASKTFAQKHNYKVNPRQELLALGFANFGAAFASGYPVSGGLSQSTVNDKAGAKTPLALIFSSCALIIILLFFTHLLKNLPDVILAVVVLDAVLGLIKVKALKQLYSLSKMEFAVALIALLGVLIFGILKGVLIAALSSIIILIVKTKLSSVALLGQIPGTEKFSDLNRNPDNYEIPGIRILRIESAILYFNEENIHEMLYQFTIEGDKDLKLVILDLSATPNIDVSGGKMLLEFSNELREKGIRLKIVEALGIVRDLMRKLGMEEVIGHISRKDSIYNEVSDFQKSIPTL